MKIDIYKCVLNGKRRASRRAVGRSDAWFDYRLENDARFLRRIEQARNSLRAGRGVRLENIETE